MTAESVRSFAGPYGWKLFEHVVEEDPINEAQYWAWRDRTLDELSLCFPDVYRELMDSDRVLMGGLD